MLDLVFADLDKAFGIVCQCGFIGRWELPDFKPCKNGRPGPEAKWRNAKSIDFITDNRNPTSQDKLFKLGVAGTDGTNQRFKVIE